MDIHILSEILALLLVACGVALIAEWLKQPYTIALVLVGLGIALTKFAPHMVISKEVIFTIVLPPLLFHGALHMDLEHLKDNWKKILLLAVPGVICSTFFIGYLLHVFWKVDLIYGLLFGALITPTDPVSVLSILKKVGAPERLRTILEGESLFNDGTGVVVFSVILGIATGKEHFELSHTIFEFLKVAIGGTVVGLVFGYLAYRILKHIHNHLIEVSLTIVLAFGVPLFAEHFHLSGMIAVVVAGLIMGNYGRIFSMSEETRVTVENFWEVIEFIVNSLIFLAIGIELQVIHLSDLQSLWLLILIGIVISLLGRVIVIYPMTGFANKIFQEGIPWRWTHVFSWGGLKGAIPIALVVGLPADFPHRALFLTAAFGIVLFSLILQGGTIKMLVERLGLAEKK